MAGPPINIIEWLKTNVSGGDVLVYGLILLCVWEVLWHFVICKRLNKKLEKRYSKFIANLLEIGAGGIFCIILFLLIVIALVVQAIILMAGSPDLIPSCALFMSIVIGFFAFLFKGMNKKK